MACQSSCILTGTATGATQEVQPMHMSTRSIAMCMYSHMWLCSKLPLAMCSSMHKGCCTCMMHKDYNFS